MILPLTSAEIFINNDTEFNLGNGANITIKAGEIFDEPIILNQTNVTLTLNRNTSQMIFNTSSNKTISNFSYNFLADRMQFDVIGTSESLNMTATMGRFNTFYNLTNDTLFYAENISNTNKVVIFNFSSWVTPNHTLVIEVNLSSITFFTLNGTVLNKLNESIPLANITILNKTYNITDINGYYIVQQLEPGNYTLKAIKFPYSNKTINFNITDANKTLNFSMNAKTGNVQPEEDYTPIYIIIIFILFTLYASKTRQFNDAKENIFGYLKEEEMKKHRGKKK